MKFPARVPMALLLGVVVAVPMLIQAQIPENAVPLQTSLTELRLLNAEYAKAYNEKDVAKLATFYSEDAVVVRPDGSVLEGIAAITADMKATAATWPHLVLTPQQTDVYGSTAFQSGLSAQHMASGEDVQTRYFAVLKRGYQHNWTLFRLVSVPLVEGMED